MSQLSMTNSERNYDTSQKELLAVVKSLEHFKQFLFGKEFVIKIDHNPLTSITTKSKPSVRLRRWLSELADYQFKIIIIGVLLKSRFPASSFSNILYQILYSLDREFKIEHKKGADNILAYALPRQNLSNCEEEDLPYAEKIINSVGLQFDPEMEILEFHEMTEEMKTVQPEEEPEPVELN